MSLSVVRQAQECAQGFVIVLEVEWWLLRVCCYEDARIKIYVVKIYTRQYLGERNLLKNTLREKKIIKTKLTAVKLLT